MCNMGRLHRLTYFASILDSCAGDRLGRMYVDCDTAACTSGRIEYTEQKLMQSVWRWIVCETAIELNWNRRCHGLGPATPYAPLRQRADNKMSKKKDRS